MPRSRAFTIIACVIVPAFAIVIAGRQLYLSKFDTLSTWKGGGMGMFASADVDRRFFRIWIGPPNGTKHLVFRTVEPQTSLMLSARYYPRPRIFEKVANSLRATKFISSGDLQTVAVFDRSGAKLRTTDRRFYLLNGTGPRPDGDRLAWDVIIEAWEMRLDVTTKVVTETLIETYKFPPPL